jgi:D-alanyl-D-alanine carboxypeptidase
MTTHHDSRSDQRTRVRAQRFLAVAIAAVVAAVLTVAGTPGQASAAVAGAPQKWSSLMYHSLTPSPAYVRLRKTLAGQRATLKTRAAQLTRGTATHEAAQTELTAAVTADATARNRYSVAAEALTTAKNTYAAVSLQRPRNRTVWTEARTAVLDAAETSKTLRARARQAAAALRTAQTAARAATAGLDKAAAAWKVADARVRTNQQKLIRLDKTAELAGQAAALSRDVVTQARAGFTVADTTTVNGITVHKNVAFAFRRMLADAKADGIALSGGGFRTKQRQIELRKINGCPNVWTAPASSCRVPTAIPGRSLHELGLAVDVSSGGRTIAADSAAFRWLVANARRYGFVNLPSEAWHWSITGG